VKRVLNAAFAKTITVGVWLYTVGVWLYKQFAYPMNNHVCCLQSNSEAEASAAIQMSSHYE
jgi:hypothetical protein